MLTTRFERTYVCDRCGDSGTYMMDYRSEKPDGWFTLSGKHPDRIRPMRDKHFCSECFVELFGYRGKAWDMEFEEECDSFLEDLPEEDIPWEAEDKDEEEDEVNRFFFPGQEEPFLTVTIHADGTSSVERNDDQIGEMKGDLRTSAITVEEALDKVETEDWRTDNIDLSKFKSIGEISEMRIACNGGYVGIVEDTDDDLYIGLTD